jgi:hypothetical protein
MSRVPDLLERIREDLGARLAELRPLVEEHGRLDAAMRALGDVEARVPGRAAAKSPATTKSGARKTQPAKRRKRARRGANREAVLLAASERPGATSGELAAVSGVEPNTLSGLLARLVKAGELQTSVLPTGRTGYALAQTPAQPAQPAQPAGAGSATGEASAGSGAV